MIFDNLLFHNVAELQKMPDNNGYCMLRVPKEVEGFLSEKGKGTNTTNCGVEIRFVMPKEGEAKIRLRYVPSLKKSSIMTEGEALGNEGKASGDFTRAVVSYGNFGYSTINITTEENEYTFALPKEDKSMMDRVQIALPALSKEYGYPFDPMCVRICLHETNGVVYSGSSGNIMPPTKEMMPEKSLLIYGSSITHGSLGLVPGDAYAARLCENLGYDQINLGFAGSCAIEPEMADYIAKRDDWDTALMELGVNVINHIDEVEYKKRVDYFIKKVAGENKEKKVFFTDIFYQNMDIVNNPKIEVFRKAMQEAIKENNLSNVCYINGFDVADASCLSADLVHFSADGCKKVAENLAKIMKEVL